jgi:hypothetical protein
MPIRIPDPTFHVDADPDRGPDPDLTQSFYVGKSKHIFDFYLQQCQSRLVYIARQVTGVIISIF